MGKLKDALAPISSYAAKKTPLWDEVTDRIAGAILPADLDDVELWLEWHELEVPWPWREPLAELIEKQREALEAEDISLILREKFDFT
jgi:hypothetical protein